MPKKDNLMDSIKELSLQMYESYGIAEWPKKYMTLAPEDKLNILNYINGNCPKKESIDALLELLKLPFPKFIERYFSDSEEFMDRLSHDPQLSYKVYFLSDMRLQFFSMILKNPSLTVKEIQEILNCKAVHIIGSINQVLNLSLDDMGLYSVSQQGSERIRQFIYLTQYIDLEEAKRLGLSSYNTFLNDGVNGYELERKINMLNPTIRSLMIYYLGLYGHNRHSCKEIFDVIDQKKEKTHKVVEFICPLLMQSTGVFKNAIGFSEERQIPGNSFEYTNKAFRSYDIEFETRALSRTLDEASIAVLERYTPLQRKNYLAAKFMFKTPESLARNLCLSTETAKKYILQANYLVTE